VLLVFIALAVSVPLESLRVPSVTLPVSIIGVMTSPLHANPVTIALLFRMPPGLLVCVLLLALFLLDLQQEAQQPSYVRSILTLYPMEMEPLHVKLNPQHANTGVTHTQSHNASVQQHPLKEMELALLISALRRILTYLYA